MSLKDDTQDLNRALDDMKSRSRALNDSLRILAEEGFDRLSRAAQGQARQNSAGSRKNAGDIASEELARVLKSEIGDALRQVFGGGRETGRSTGANVLNVIINNNTPAQVTTRETGDGFDQKTLEITIDQMVAQSLVRGRQTSSVLQSLFGLSPSLIGR